MIESSVASTSVSYTHLLHCTGCWAAEYGNKLNLTFDEIDSIIMQGKEMGIYMYIYTGGEPLVRKKDLIA